MTQCTSSKAWCFPWIAGCCRHLAGRGVCEKLCGGDDGSTLLAALFNSCEVHGPQCMRWVASHKRRIAEHAELRGILRHLVGKLILVLEFSLEPVKLLLQPFECP